MKKMNMYFFGSEKIHISDALYFYVSIAAGLLITCAMALIAC